MPQVKYDFFVQWHLTERCNLGCLHCYQGERAPELRFDEICRGIDNVKSAQDGWAADYALAVSPSLNFTGGEPLVRGALFAILDYARNAGFSTSLLNNGTLITREIARKLRESGVSEVQVSLEGLEAIHDRIRGEGSFRKAVAGIERLIEQNISTHINLTLSRLNMGELSRLARFAGEIGVNRLTYSRLVACGAGGGLVGEMLESRELRELHRRLRGLSCGGASITSRDPLALVAGLEGDPPDIDFPVGGCAAGVFGITIGSDGAIMPCRRMNLVIGNIRADSLRELWAESPVLTNLRRREAYHDGCDACAYWAMCRGCRAVALASSRASGGEDYLGPDPQCPYYRGRAPA